MPSFSALTVPSPRVRWRSYRRVPSTRLPRRWRRWLLDQGSLTQRLQEASDGHFHVEISYQGWDKPTLSEAKILQINPRQRALIREVKLCGHNTPWVYARSVIPASTLTGQLRILKHLGTRPLGALLFNNPMIVRGTIEIAELELRQSSATQAHQPRAWARRSVFSLAGKSLLVTEVFLNALLQVQ